MKPGYSYGREFEFGLDLMLAGLENALAAAQRGLEVEVEVGRRLVDRVVGKARAQGSQGR